MDRRCIGSWTENWEPEIVTEANPGRAAYMSRAAGKPPAFRSRPDRIWPSQDTVASQVQGQPSSPSFSSNCEDDVGDSPRFMVGGPSPTVQGFDIQRSMTVRRRETVLTYLWAVYPASCSLSPARFWIKENPWEVGEDGRGWKHGFTERGTGRKNGLFVVREEAALKGCSDECPGVDSPHHICYP